MTMQRSPLDALLRGILPTTFIAPRQLQCAEELRTLRAADDHATALRLARWALLRGAVYIPLATQLIGEDNTLHDALVRDHPAWFDSHSDGRIRMADEVRRIVLAAHSGEQLQALLEALLERLDDALERGTGDAQEHYALEHVAHLLRAHPVRHEELFTRALDAGLHIRQRQVSGDGRWTIDLLRTATDAACMRHDKRAMELGLELYAQQRAEGAGAEAIAHAAETGDLTRLQALIDDGGGQDAPLDQARLARIMVGLHAATTTPTPRIDVLRMLMAALPAEDSPAAFDANDLCSPLLIHRVTNACLRFGVDPAPLLRTGTHWSVNLIDTQQIADAHDVQALHAMNNVCAEAGERQLGLLEIITLLADTGRFEEALDLVPTLDEPMPADRARGRIANAMARSARLDAAEQVLGTMHHRGERRRVMLVIARQCADAWRRREALHWTALALREGKAPSDCATAMGILHRAGEAEQARELFAEAVAAVQPGDERGWADLVRAAGELGLTHQAFDACELAPMNAVRVTALSRLAHALRAADNPDGAGMATHMLHMIALGPDGDRSARRAAALHRILQGEPAHHVMAGMLNGIDDHAERATLLRDLARGLYGHIPAQGRRFARHAHQAARDIQDATTRAEGLTCTTSLFVDLALWDDARECAMEVDDTFHRRMAHRILLLHLEALGEHARITRVWGDMLLCERSSPEPNTWDTPDHYRSIYAQRGDAHLQRVLAGGAAPVPKPPLRRTLTAEHEAWLTDICTAELQEPGADTQRRLEAVFTHSLGAVISFTNTHPWLTSAAWLRMCSESGNLIQLTGLLVANGGDPAVFHHLLEITVDAEERQDTLQSQHRADSIFNGAGTSFGLAQIALSSTEPGHLRRRLRKLLLEQWLEFDRKLPGHASALRLLNLQGLGLE